MIPFLQSSMTLTSEKGVSRTNIELGPQNHQHLIIKCIYQLTLYQPHTEMCLLPKKNHHPGALKPEPRLIQSEALLAEEHSG